jgi:predicted TIM-barrel fold metal-dependent hydrolase
MTTSPFAVAISVLVDYVGLAEANDAASDAESFRAAIRVLEAAGKVDKDGGSAWAEWAADSLALIGKPTLWQKISGRKNPYQRNLQDIRGFENSIRALLSALPDPDQAKEKA